MAPHRCRDRHRHSRRGLARAGPSHLLPAAGGIDGASAARTQRRSPSPPPTAPASRAGSCRATPTPAPAVLYFGGNAEEVSWTLGDGRWPRAWTRIALNYRGYGTSEGKPGARALLADGLAALRRGGGALRRRSRAHRRVRTQPRHRGCDARRSATSRGRRDPRVALRFARRRRPHPLPVPSGVAPAAPPVRARSRTRRVATRRCSRSSPSADSIIPIRALARAVRRMGGSEGVAGGAAHRSQHARRDARVLGRDRALPRRAPSAHHGTPNHGRHDQVDYVSGKTRLFGIVGHPIEQVRSPEMITAEMTGARARRGARADARAAGRVRRRCCRSSCACAISAVSCSPFRTRRARAPCRRARRAGARGRRDQCARARQGRQVARATSSTATGCVEAFRRRGISFAGKRVMLIGAGGAGSAIAMAIGVRAAGRR